MAYIDNGDLMNVPAVPFAGTPAYDPNAEQMSSPIIAAFPRRNRIDLMTEAERAIYDAMQTVERAGSHPLLTDAVDLLQRAKDKVSDHVDI